MHLLIFNWQECLPTENRGQGNKYIREKPNSLTVSIVQAIKEFETVCFKRYKMLEENNIFVPLVI